MPVVNVQFFILHSMEKNTIHLNKLIPNSLFTRKKVCFSKCLWFCYLEGLETKAWKKICIYK